MDFKGVSQEPADSRNSFPTDKMAFAGKSGVKLGLLVVLFVLLKFTLGSEVMGCGGFVKSTKSNIDLSRIQIALFAKQNGNLR